MNNISGEFMIFGVIWGRLSPLLRCFFDFNKKIYKKLKKLLAFSFYLYYNSTVIEILMFQYF